MMDGCWRMEIENAKTLEFLMYIPPCPGLHFVSYVEKILKMS